MNDIYKRPQIEITLDTVKGASVAIFKLNTHLGGDTFNTYRDAINGATYESTDRTNRATLDKVIPILHRLRDAGFTATVAEDLRAALQKMNAEKKLFVEEAAKRAIKIDVELKKRGLNLYPFQKIGAEWMSGRVGGLLADQMGLGKSVQALMAVPDGLPVLVVCPRVVRGVWAREAATWRPDLEVDGLQGRDGFRWPQNGELCIINYDVLPLVEFLDSRGVTGFKTLPGVLPGTTVIFDEAHYLKSFKSRRTQASRLISDDVRAAKGRTWALTATPLLGSPPELWSVLQAVGCAQEAFGSYKDFVELFGGVEDKWGAMRWGTPDESVPERLKRVSIRRERKDVLPDLPEKTFRFIEVPIDRLVTKLCDKAWEDLKKAGIDLESAEALALASKENAIELPTVSQARSALAIAKIPSMLELIELFEEEGEPVIVFSKHRGPIDALAERPGWETITGSNSKDAQAVADLFQAGRLKGIGATIQAGGVGITLTRAANELFVDEDWTPALNEQAQDRAVRIGQTRGVVITILVADHTMDKHVAKVLRKKTTLISRTVEASKIGGDVKPAGDITEDELRQLFAECVAENQEDVRTLPHYAFTPEELRISNLLDSLPANDAGWPALDLAVARSLAESLKQKGALTHKQWELAVRLFEKEVV